MQQLLLQSLLRVLIGKQNQQFYTGLIRLLREPYSKTYVQGNVQAWLTAAGFDETQTHAVGWLHQVSSGIKAIPSP